MTVGNQPGSSFGVGIDDPRCTGIRDKGIEVGQSGTGFHRDGERLAALCASLDRSRGRGMRDRGKGVGETGSGLRRRNACPS